MCVLFGCFVANRRQTTRKFWKMKMGALNAVRHSVIISVTNTKGRQDNLLAGIDDCSIVRGGYCRFGQFTIGI